MKALLISYNLKKASINQKTTIQQSLYGYTDYSNGGRYKYERQGLLDKIGSVKLNRGVFIINLKDKTKILSILKKNSATIQTLIVEISKLKLKKT